MKKGKLGAYKTHIIKNIEKIGQKKLVVMAAARTMTCSCRLSSSFA